MEISNNTHFSADAYLLSQQKYKAEPGSVSPLKQIDKDQKSNQDQAADNKDLVATKRADKATEPTLETTENTPFQLVNITKAKNSPQNTSYKITAHDEQIARHAEKAVSSYNAVENSQYGQELVNRIELMV